MTHNRCNSFRCIVMSRWPALFLLSLALGLAAWSVSLYVGAPEQLPPVSIESPERDLGSVPAGEEQEVVFRVRNPGGRQCRIMGAPFD